MRLKLATPDLKYWNSGGFGFYYGSHVLTYIAASQWRSQKIVAFDGDKVKVKLRKGSSSLEPQKTCLRGITTLKQNLEKGALV